MGMISVMIGEGVSIDISIPDNLPDWSVPGDRDPVESGEIVIGFLPSELALLRKFIYVRSVALVKTNIYAVSHEKGYIRLKDKVYDEFRDRIRLYKSEIRVLIHIFKQALRCHTKIWGDKIEVRENNQLVTFRGPERTSPDHFFVLAHFNIAKGEIVF